MKKFISILLWVIMICSLTACSNRQTDNMEEQQVLWAQIEDLKRNIEELKEMQQAQSGKIALYEEQLALLNEQIKNLSGLEIEYTEETPFYGRSTDRTVYKEFDRRTDETVSFAGFLDYYRKNLKEKLNCSFYFLSPLDPETFENFHPNYHRVYTVYAESVTDGVPVNPIICERMMMYSEVLGDGGGFNIGMEGYSVFSIDLEIYSVSVIKDRNYEKPSLEFGKLDNIGYWNSFINIFMGKDCVATCYYNTNAYVSRTWFEYYFSANYIKE